MTCAFTRALALSLPLALALAAGCDEASDADADAEHDTSSHDELPGECVSNPAKPTLVSITSLDDDPFPDLDASCTLAAASHDGSLSTVELACPTDAGTNKLAIEVVGEAVPPALVVGESYDFHLARNSEPGSPELDLMLADASGPIVAAIDYSPTSVTWGPFSLRFATDCPDPEPEGPGVDGFVRFTSDDATVDVLVGSPKTVSAGGLSWTAYAGSAHDGCCHGSSFSAALVRL